MHSTQCPCALSIRQEYNELVILHFLPVLGRRESLTGRRSRPIALLLTQDDELICRCYDVWIIACPSHGEFTGELAGRKIVHLDLPAAVDPEARIRDLFFLSTNGIQLVCEKETAV